MEDFILTLWQTGTQGILQGIFFLFGDIDFSVFSVWQIIIDIALLTTILFFLLKLIRKAHAVKVLATTLFFGLLWFISDTFHLTASHFVLQGIILLILFSLPVLFQDEIRKFTETFTNSSLFFIKKEYLETQRHKLIKTIKQASKILSEKRQGAILVIENTQSLDIYAETGVMLEAQVSKELLLSIFFPKSPLHDGAVIIRGNTVISAGAVLPLARNPSEYRYGTRHKSSLGLSEVTDAIIIVISEERGEISIAKDGKLILNISADYLEHHLKEHLPK